MTTDNSPNLLTLEFYEDDMWQHIQSKESKQGYIKNLIREDMNKIHAPVNAYKPPAKKALRLKTYGMNTSLGIKWFVFYAMIRPWLSCLAALFSFAYFIQFPETYTTNPGLLISVFVRIVEAVLCVITFIKANDYYGDFVKLVRFVLIFEAIAGVYHIGAERFYLEGINSAISASVFPIVVGYFWYRLNMEYFKKRLR